MITDIGRTEYQLLADNGDWGDIRIGGKDPEKFAPNINLAFNCYSQPRVEHLFLNFNSMDLIVTDETLTHDAGTGLVTLQGSESADLFYTKDNNFKWDRVFNRRPATNVFRWRIRKSPEIYFAYQAPLTAQQEADGVQRIEKSNGSYVAFSRRAHKIRRPDAIRQADRSIFANYFNGKLAHIYRPLCIDYDGNEVYADLNITGDIMTVTIPQSFLDSARYPMTLDPEIGYNGGDMSGSSNNNAGSGDMFVCNFPALTAGNGTLDTIYFYTKNINTDAKEILLVLYSDDSGSPDALLDQTAVFFDAAITFGSPSWTSASDGAVLTGVSLINGVVYDGGFQQESGGEYRFWDDDVAFTIFSNSNPTWPTPEDPYVESGSIAEDRMGCYADYTLSAAGAVMSQLQKANLGADLYNGTLN